MRCPDRGAWQTRKPEFIEQLISPAMRTHHQITSKTPITSPNGSPLPVPHTPVLELPDDKDGKFVRATLASYNLPSSSIKENRRVLEAFGALTGKKVVYLQNEKDIAEKQAKKTAKKTIKVKSGVQASAKI
jgi:hypothetical protein